MFEAQLVIRSVVDDAMLGRCKKSGYICGGAMRSRTSVPLGSLKFFFFAVITVVAGGLSRTQLSLSPSMAMAPLESSCRFDLGSFASLHLCGLHRCA